MRSLFAQRIKQFTLTGNILQQGIALTQGMTTTRFLVTAHQSRIGSIQKQQLVFLAAGLHLIQNLQQLIKKASATDINNKSYLFLRSLTAKLRKLRNQGRRQIVNAKEI